MKAFPKLAQLASGVMAISTSLCAADIDNRIESAFGSSDAFRICLKDDAIKTASRNGVVTLTGQVTEASHKTLAHETVAALPEVRGVDNRLAVTLAGTEQSDACIRARVLSVLALRRGANGISTQVDVHDGGITLRGSAASEAQRDLATQYALAVPGVLGVTNLLTVLEPTLKTDELAPESVDDASIAAQVKVALLLHTQTSSAHASVRTSAGIVTLSGTARNAAERTLVTTVATDINGVKQVINNMTLTPSLSATGVKPRPVQMLRVVGTGN